MKLSEEETLCKGWPTIMDNLVDVIIVNEIWEAENPR